MSKNVRIDQESIVGTYNGISQIKTDLMESGQQRWIPEDEYDQYLNRGTLTVTENGTYNPADDGYSSYSQVTVRIGDNDNYDYDVDGSEPDPGYTYTDPTTGLEIDPIDIPDNPVDNIKTNKYVGPGTVTGIDPETGEPTAVSTDAEGRIQKTPIPDHIEVIVPPGVSTTYNEGDTINYNQYTYHAYKANGEAFILDDTQYIPNLIPFGEMEFPVTTAQLPNGSNSEHTSGDF